MTLRSSRLKLEFKVMNADDKPLSFTAALHTYLEVVDVAVPAVRVTGLQGKTYLDKVPDPKKPVEKARARGPPPHCPLLRRWFSRNRGTVGCGTGLSCELTHSSPG